MPRCVVGILAALALAYLSFSGCGGSPGDAAYQQGLEAFERDDFVAARAHLEKSISRRPGSLENASAYNLIGVCCWKLGECDAAVSAFEHSRDLDDAYAEPVYNLGVLHYTRTNLTQAATLFRGAALLDASDPRPLEYLARLQQDRGLHAEAAGSLQQALERAPDSPRILAAMGLATLETHGPAPALDWFERALGADPRYGPAYLNLAAVHQRWFRDEAKAREYLEGYLAHARDPVRRASAEARLAALRPASPPAPGDPAASSATPQPFGPAQGSAGARSPGHGSVTNSTPSDPRTPAGWLDRAREHANRGDAESAYNACRRAVALAGKSGDARLREHVAREATAICPDKAGPSYSMGLALLDLNKPREALRVFRRTVALEPSWPAAYLALAEAAVRAEEYDAAFVALRRALKLDAENAEALWALAVLHDLQFSARGQAREAYREFVRLHPTDPRAERAREKLRQLPVVVPEEEPVPAASSVPNAAGTSPGTGSEYPVVEPTAPPEGGGAAAPEAEGPKRREALDAYNRGVAWQARGEWAQAALCYRRALGYDPALAFGHYNLGCVYQRMGDDRPAEKAYREALRLRPRLADARYNLATVLQQRGESQEAIRELNRLLLAQPNYARAHHLLALLYAERPATRQRAVAHSRAFLRLAPHDPAAAALRQWLSSQQR
jgi:tetratricopeptide (TPR) repeat protein